MLNKTNILLAVSCFCFTALAWSQPGSGTEQAAKKTHVTEGASNMNRSGGTTRGGDGGSVSRWERDKTMSVFTGEEGKKDGSGGAGGSPTDTANTWHVSADEDGIVVRGHGRVAQISWKDIEALKKQSQ
jgi:hypothetical protein